MPIYSSTLLLNNFSGGIYEKWLFFIVVLHIPPQKKHNNTEGPDSFLIIMNFITKTAKPTEQTESLTAS